MNKLETLKKSTRFFTFFVYNLIMLLISFFVLAMYLIMMVVEHYQCNTKTGLDITTKVKIGIELGLFSLTLEIINSHVILVYTRFLLFNEVKKWGFYS